MYLGVIFIGDCQHEYIFLRSNITYSIVLNVSLEGAKTQPDKREWELFSVIVKSIGLGKQFQRGNFNAAFNLHLSFFDSS